MEFNRQVPVIDAPKNQIHNGINSYASVLTDIHKLMEDVWLRGMLLGTMILNHAMWEVISIQIIVNVLDALMAV